MVSLLFKTNGIVDLFIQFADQHTPIQAHIVPTLCTDLIISMDYINRYFLNINIQDRTLSIQFRGKLTTTSIDHDQTLNLIPLLLPHHVRLPSNCSLCFTIPISFTHTLFIPNVDLEHDPLIVISSDLFQPHDRSIRLKIFNHSPSFRFMKKGTCIGYSFRPSFPQSILPTVGAVFKSDDNTSSSGEVSEPSDLADTTVSFSIQQVTFVGATHSTLDCGRSKYVCSM